MNKFSKTILFLIFTTFLVGMPFLAVAENGLEIESDEPLFEVENFFPSQTASSDITITNNFENKEELRVETKNIEGDEGFAEYLKLSVENGGNSCFKTVEELSGDNECDLGELDGGESKEFQFTITFLPGSGNEYQNSKVEFDFLFTIGEENETNEEDPDTTTLSGTIGRSAVGVEDEELIIFNESREVYPERAIIIWETNLPATSKVIYGRSLGAFDYNVGPPAYGFENYSENEQEATSHHIDLSNLQPSTTYYYRIASYLDGVPTITSWYYFTTSEEGEVLGEDVERKEPAFEPTPEEVTENGEEEGEVRGEEEIEEDDEEEIFETDTEETEEEEGIRCWLLILILLVIIGILLYLLSRYFRKKEK